MFSPKQLMVSCLTLVCLENRKNIFTNTSTELVAKAIDTIPKSDAGVDIDRSFSTQADLLKLIEWLVNKTSDNFPAEIEILQKVQVVTRDEEYLYNSIKDTLIPMEPDETMQVVQSFRDTLARHINEEKIKTISKKYHHKLNFKKNVTDNTITILNEMNAELAPYMDARNKNTHPAQMGAMDFGNLEELKTFFNEAASVLSTDGAFKTGWKALNRMLGPVGAVRRGEFATVAALQHNFKSQMSMAIFCHFCMFNTPFLRDPRRKPLMVFVSLENELPQNLIWMYQYIRENIEGIPVIPGEVDAEEAAKYVSEKLSATGFHIRMLRFDPTNFTIADFTVWLDGLIADGYEICALFCDYLNMLSKSGIDSKVAGDDIRLLFRRMRNYTSNRGITFWSPHQMSSDAMRLLRDNVEDFVRVVAGKGFYDGCTRLGQEPDLELFIHKITVAAKDYLTIARGKHRYTVTPMKDQYCVLPFSAIKTIEWDIDKDYEVTVDLVAMDESNEEYWD